MGSRRVRILLTGGRAFVTLDLARQFAHAGHHVVVAESVPVHLCRYSQCVNKSYLVPRPNSEPGAYIDALIRIIQVEQIDLVIPTCEEIFFIAGELDRLSACCAVFSAPLAQLERLHSKWDFNQLVRHYGLCVPETHLLTSQHDLQRFLTYNQRPFVIKPVFSRFATQVIIVESVEQPGRTFEELDISDTYPWIAQEKIEGQAFCSYSIAHAGKLAAHTVYAENFTAGQGACIQFAPVEHPEIDSWIERFVNLAQFSGQIAFDFIVTEAGHVYPLECNPRATSGIHLFQGDRQLPSAFLERNQSDQPVLRPGVSMQAMIAPAMLVYGLLAVRSWKRLKEWLCIFWQARDVIFDVRDIRPFLSQPLILWYNLRGSRALDISLQAFATIDIEWNGQRLDREGSLV